MLVRHAQLPLHPGSYTSRLLKTETAAVERLLRTSIGVRGSGERSDDDRGELLMRRISPRQLVGAAAAVILYKGWLILACQLRSPSNYKICYRLQI